MLKYITSIWNRDNRNNINTAIDVLNQLGVKIQDLVAKGQLTPTQYATLIQTVNGLISKGNITIDDFSEDLLNEINKNDPNFEILSIPRDRSVTPTKTTFLSETENLFDGIYYPYALVQIAGGGLRVVESHDVETGGLIILPATASTTYTVKSYDVDDTDAFRIGLSNRELEFSDFRIFGIDDKLINQSEESTYPEREYTFTTNASTEYMFIYVSKTGKEPRVQIERGSQTSGYTEPYKISKFIGIPEQELQDESVTPTKTTFFEPSNNLFDGRFNNWFMSRLGTPLTAYLRRNHADDHNTSMTEVEPGATYTVKIHDIENSNEFMIMTSKGVPVFDGRGIFETERDLILQGRVTHPNREYTFTIPDEHHYLYVMTGTNIDPPNRLQIEKGETATPYQAPYVLKEGYYTAPLNNEVKNKEVKNLSFFDFYSVPTLEGVNSPNSTHKIHDQTSTSMYALYDALMAEYPDYITKFLATTESTGKPIYGYKFHPKVPPFTRTPKETDLLEFLVVSGVHGSEKAAWWCLYETMKQICENWKTSPALSNLRWDVKFTVIPLVNVYGIDNTQDPVTYGGKINSNGVDIHRNFPVGFSSGTPGSVGYGGSEPLTEPEAIMIADLIVENNFDFYVDFHNFSSQSDPNVFVWNLSDDDYVLNMSQRYISQLSQKWKVDEDGFPQQDTDFFGQSSVGTPGTTPAYVKSEGIPGGVFEITHTMYPTGNTAQYSSEVITLGTEAQLNWIYMAYMNLTN